MGISGRSNSTTPVHGHSHHHLANLDGTKTSDEVIILILGAIVILTFALGLVFQLCDDSVWFFWRKQGYWQEEEDNRFGQDHQMAELNLEAAAAAITDPLIKGDSHQPLPSPWATRYGTITQHHVDIGGVRKMVLIVEGDRTNGVPQEQDGYTEWFERWRGRHETKADVEAGEQALDERDFWEQDALPLEHAPRGTVLVDEQAPLLQFDLEEDGNEHPHSDPEQKDAV
ncbi:hypothetical protein BJX63DRAFT_431648 [Aspergillus granulosus]|uniref:Uncharacterized protein n=1 Tax=Aspergillus granulosus TaxID=176169 RepID=A0ABR4HF30_9EURO